MTRTGLSPAKQALLAQRLKAGKAARVTVPPRPAGTHPPLSHAQERLWFLEQYAPGTTAYTVAFAVRLDGGEIDGAALERALTEVARRHESLRTRFVTTTTARRRSCWTTSPSSSCGCRTTPPPCGRPCRRS
ncbi:condensation domain-containing protein [Microbispora sp. GKU 823]|uniref:condensation domain-containing protein n=1 Tax=Microbispora sp. GKU 823 TaxID=1652100 RepID=UPI0009D33B5C|nr:condensation domain-containing protein [Microbispora sp. GKU 823]OPG12804.1 hypothetical protein B1L11_11935 [Microbispora sp. GKU 823]